MREESLGTQAGVHLRKGVRLIWGPLNTGFTVKIRKISNRRSCSPKYAKLSRFTWRRLAEDGKEMCKDLYNTRAQLRSLIWYCDGHLWIL